MVILSTNVFKTLTFRTNSFFILSFIDLHVSAAGQSNFLPISPLSVWTKSTSCPPPLLNLSSVTERHNFTYYTSAYAFNIVLLKQLNVGLISTASDPPQNANE